MPVTALRVERSYNSRRGGRPTELIVLIPETSGQLGPLPPPYYQGGRGTRASPAWLIFTVTWTLRAVANVREDPFSDVGCINRDKYVAAASEHPLATANYQHQGRRDFHPTVVPV